VPEVRDVYDCNLETRSETDLRMSALRARGDALSQGKVKAESARCRTVFAFFASPAERNRPFRVDEHGRGYRKAYRTGACRRVDQHRGVDRVFQRRACVAVDEPRFDAFFLTRTAARSGQVRGRAEPVIWRAFARPVGSTAWLAAFPRSSPAVNEVPAPPF
jgi:hypothetical protein